VPAPTLVFEAAATAPSLTWLGVVLALVGAVFLSIGAQLQHHGVEKVEARYGSGKKQGLSVGQLLRLAARPSWLFGSLMLGLAVIFQLTALGFAPLIVVQPIGVVALVITAVVNARVSHVKLDSLTIRAMGFCVVGIAAFVTVAAFVATEHAITELQLTVVLVLLVIVLLALALGFAFFRRRFTAIFYIVAAGVLYGFVATLAKVIINRLLTGNFEWLTLTCGVALLVAMALGMYFVQVAYSVGSPDLVIAGLTVVDPLVAVSIGIFVLGEASGAPAWALVVFAIAGAIAIYGVFQLAKHHPQTHRRDPVVEAVTAL
jgi:hypothetical protein